MYRTRGSSNLRVVLSRGHRGTRVHNIMRSRLAAAAAVSLRVQASANEPALVCGRESDHVRRDGSPRPRGRWKSRYR